MGAVIVIQLKSLISTFHGDRCIVHCFKLHQSNYMMRQIHVESDIFNIATNVNISTNVNNVNIAFNVNIANIVKIVNDVKIVNNFKIANSINIATMSHCQQC